MPAGAKSAINLLPWREIERRRSNRVWLAALGGVLAAGIVLVFTAARSLDSSIESQERRNRLLEGESALLDKRIAEARSLRGHRKRLLERLAAIRRLQNRRQATVRVFEELANTLPDGMHYQRLEMQGRLLKVRGVADSSQRISLLMRNLERSARFSAGNLERIREDRENGEYGAQAGTFEMTFVLQHPDADGAVKAGH